MDLDQNIMKLNVGGRIFEATRTTVRNAGENSPLGNMFCVASVGYFIDRDPDYFVVLLNLLRTGELHIPSNLSEKLLYREALYYGILDHVKSAKSSPFDGNRLHLARSITGWSMREGGHEVITRAIRASQSTGWCCVAHGNVVHVYDWMMEQHPIIHLEYNKLNDVCWVDAENIVVSANKKIANGSMGLFSAATGELRYRFSVMDGRDSYTPGVLCVNSDKKLFSSCKSTSNGHGIGVWDQVTGLQIDFLSCSHSNASRLQWLHGTNCLMVTGFHPTTEKCYISLLDFRTKTVALLWCDERGYITDETKIRDAIVIEKSNSICVVDKNERLAFLDLRSIAGASLNWRSSSYTGNNLCYPRLEFHEGQLFSSISDRISVYCGSDWVLTSQIRQRRDGPICDFSIGGDCLFALHSKENVIDVWETPRPPII